MTATEEPRRPRGRPPSGGREAILDATLAVLREEGIANLTSRAVAARAGVSDASVYYHFGDRAGLLQAVFEHGMGPLMFMAGLDPETMDPGTAIRGAFAALQQFFEEVLPVLLAAQADPELRSIVAQFVELKNRGPHRGVKLLGDYLRSEQAAGRVNPDADVDAIALLVIDSAFAAAARRQMHLEKEELLPPSEALLDQISRLLS
jgi:AcrR family transcriptional regulator